MEDFQFEAEFLTWDQASQNTFTFVCHLTSTLGIRVSWDPFHPDWIASATNIDIAQAMINTQHLVNIQHKDKWRRAQTMEVESRYHAVRRRRNIYDENGRPRYNYRVPNPSRGHSTNLPHPFPTLLQLSQLTEPNRTLNIRQRVPGKRQEKDRMGSRDITPSGPVTGKLRLREEGRQPRG